MIHNGRRKVHDYFSLLLCKSSIWFTEKHIFKIILCIFFNTLKCATNYVISFKVHDGFIDFEAMKAGKLAIWPWLSCQYNENTLMDLLSSVSTHEKCCQMLEILFLVFRHSKNISWVGWNKLTTKGHSRPM